MTKADLVEEVSRVTELTRKDSEVIVDTLFESVIKALKNGDKLEVRGFGSFRVRQRNARVGRNPKTGEKVEVPAKRVPYFKPSKELKDLINDGTAASSSSPPTPEQLSEMMQLAQGIIRALRKLYKPDGFNIGMNLGHAAGAGIREHFHLHVVPRWFGDSNFVSITGETRVLPEELPTTYERMKAALAS